MKPVYTYKALSNTVFFFGFQPMDMGMILISTLMIWGATNSFKISFIWLCLVWFLGKKLKHRSAGSEKSFFIFITTSSKLGINNSDIPSYLPVGRQVGV